MCYLVMFLVTDHFFNNVGPDVVGLIVHLPWIIVRLPPGRVPRPWVWSIGCIKRLTWKANAFTWTGLVPGTHETALTCIAIVGLFSTWVLEIHVTVGIAFLSLVTPWAASSITKTGIKTFFVCLLAFPDQQSVHDEQDEENGLHFALLFA